MDTFDQIRSWFQDNVGNFVVVIVGLWLLSWTERPKRACKCGKSKLFYFRSLHRKCRWMVLLAVYMGLAAIGQFILDGQKIYNEEGISGWDWIFTITNTCMEFWLWRWIYFHEKDRFRRLAKAAGRVFVNKHGRLAVTND